MPARPFLIFVPLFLLAGLITALARLYWVEIPGGSLHGMLMINGFFGGIITLERAFKNRIALIAYLLLGSGLIVFVFGLEFHGLLLMFACTLLLLINEIFIFNWENRFYHFYQMLGLFAWFAGNVIFLKTDFYPASIPQWQAFVLFIIIATRLKKLGRDNNFIFLVISTSYFASLWLDFHHMGSMVIAIHLFAISCYMIWSELKVVKEDKTELTITYIWLMISGIALFFTDHLLYSYDLMVHTFFLGFAINMIFLNAGKLLAEKLNLIDLRISSLPFILAMSIGLVLRLASGLGAPVLFRIVGGCINVAVILLFLPYVIRKAIMLTRSK